MVVIGVIWGLIGLHGLVYSIEVGRRMQKQSAYQPVFEDWLFHLILPLVGCLLALSAFASALQTHRALFGVGIAALVLLFIGIHNTWDTLVYHVFTRIQDQNENSLADHNPK